MYARGTCRFGVSCESAAIAARDGLDSTDARAMARAMARALLAKSGTELQQQFRGSPMKRAKRRWLARNAAIVSGNVGTSDDVPLREAALAHDELLVREHSVRPLARVPRSAMNGRKHD